MDYFKRLQEWLQMEKDADRKSYEQLIDRASVAERREGGWTWYPIAIRDTELGRGDYLTVELERTTHHDIIHQLRFGMTAALFSNHDPQQDRVAGTITHINGNKLKLAIRTDELPAWSRNGKLGIDAVFDENSYAEMEAALKAAAALDGKKEAATLIKILTGGKAPTFSNAHVALPPSSLNSMQQEAVQKIVQANEMAIVHGPPGTGKTTTLVQAIKAIVRQKHEKVLVAAPSNAAVDLLSEKLAGEGLSVVRVGNPARVNERQLALTLDSKIAAHAGAKEIKRLKKQAAEYRDLAHKYKRNFGPAEREQRAALFAEARAIRNEIEKTEQFIIDDTVAKADVITATLVGANHYTVRNLKYGTVVIDEAGQALEPACWIPILKAQKVIMAGDHCQLPPTIKSAEAAKGLRITLMEKCVGLHPGAVVLLQEQYRMHDLIMGFPSNEFYENRLKAHPSVAQRLLFPNDQPLLFIDTAGCGFEEVWAGTSLSNPEEARFLLKHLAGFVLQLQAFHAVADFPTVAVIAPYKHQVDVLKEAVSGYQPLLEIGTMLSVNTIDAFQGQERDVVYISLTRSNSESSIGFLSEIRRMNVAMTRARKKLVVIGDSATLSGFPFYADLIAYAQAHEAYQSAWELIE